MAFAPFEPFAEGLRVVQFGLEDQAAKGTKVAADRRFATLMWDIDSKKPTTEIKRQGCLVRVGKVAQKGKTDAKAKGSASVQDIIILLANEWGVPEFDAVGGVANTAEWVPQAYANNDPVTMTMEDGFSGTGNARSFGYAYGQSLEIDFKPEKEITVTASVSGQAVETGVDLTDPVTSLDVSLLHSTDVEVRIATTEAGLDTGQIIPLDVKFKIGKVRGDVYGVAPVRSFSGTAHSMPDVSFDLVFARGVDSEGFLSSIDSDEVYYIEIIAAGVEIEDGLKNSLTIRAPIQFGNPGESAQQDAHVTTFTADCIQVDTFNVTGGFIKVTAQSAMASLS